MERSSWPFPGARWWKFDFHTHTPKSLDWLGDKAMAPETWLLQFMAAQVDAVVITDHNSGAWVDTLTAAYAGMKREADARAGHAGFRELTLFPGVEISVHGGVHVLALLEPGKTTSDVDTLLGSVGYAGEKGQSETVTSKSLVDVLKCIREAGGIAIPAHADRRKGMLERRADGTSAVDSNTLGLAFRDAGLLAVEWCGETFDPPQAVKAEAERLTRVLGSDWHADPEKPAPGSRFTWVKLATPTLDGLRLALLDGNGASIRRSDEGTFDPNHVPRNVVVALEVSNTRFMGRRGPVRVEFSPFFNAVVGGRGTGKSTLVHALRLGSGRGEDLSGSEVLKATFDAFRAVPKGRGGAGALTTESKLVLEWRQDGAPLRLTWTPTAASPSVEEKLPGGSWQLTKSQTVNAARFPVRILSQGQIAHMAGEGRRALLAIIDEAGGVGPLHEALDEAKRTFMAQRAKLRELDGKLASLPEVERQRDEIVGRLEAFTRGDHATVLRDVARTTSQLREITATLVQANEAADRAEALAGELVLDDWSRQHYGEDESDLLAWRADVDAEVEQLSQRMRDGAEVLRERVDALKQDDRLQAWKAKHLAAKAAHAELQARLAASGEADPGAFERLTHDRQGHEAKLRELKLAEEKRQALAAEIETQRGVISAARAEISAARQAFLRRVLHENEHVRMTVVPYGFDDRQVASELRVLLDLAEDKFAQDILPDPGSDPGLAGEIAAAADKVSAIEALRRRVICGDAGFSGHFRNHLTKKHKEPEFIDRVEVWFPEDDLKIEYRRGGKLYPITQGSQGQRSAALLAFLLAFGEEPIVLDQPEDDLDNHLIYDLVVRQIRENKARRQLIIVTHNPNVVVNGDAELVHVMMFGGGQCFVGQHGALQDAKVREEVCEVMEGGREAFRRRWRRLGGEG